MGGKWRARAMLVLLVTGMVLLGAAMAVYPGGTWCAPAARGHVFFENFLCDLAWHPTLSGADNHVGAVLAQAGMGAYALATTLLFETAPSIYEGALPRLARLTRRTGYAAGVGLFAVTFMPSSVFGELHALVVFVSAVPAVVALVMTLVGLRVAERPPRIAGALGAATFVAVATALVLFAYHLVVRDGCTVAVPALQKVALGLLSAWIGAVGVRTA